MRKGHQQWKEVSSELLDVEDSRKCLLVYAFRNNPERSIGAMAVEIGTLQKSYPG